MKNKKIMYYESIHWRETLLNKERNRTHNHVTDDSQRIPIQNENKYGGKLRLIFLRGKGGTSADEVRGIEKVHIALDEYSSAKGSHISLCFIALP